MFVGRNHVNKKRKENPKKRQEIIDGLIEFFKTNSLAITNMDDVAAGLNKSKATLYKYYRSKEEMVGALVDFKVREISKFVVLLNDENIDFVARYELSFKLLESHIVDISNEFLKDLKIVFPSIFNKIELLINVAVKELSLYYQKGMEQGVFNQLNALLLSQNDFIFFKTLTDPEFLSANNLSIQQAFKDFYQIRCKGLLK